MPDPMTKNATETEHEIKSAQGIQLFFGCQNKGGVLELLKYILGISYTLCETTNEGNRLGLEQSPPMTRQLSNMGPEAHTPLCSS